MSIFSDTWSMDILSLDLDIETVWDQSGDEFSSRNRLLDQLQVLSGDFSATAQKPSGVEARQLEIMHGWPTMHVVGQIMSISLFFFPFLKTFRREGFTKKEDMSLKEGGGQLENLIFL